MLLIRLTLTFFLLFHHAIYAVEFYAAPEIGVGNTNINSVYSLSGFKESNDNFGYGVSFGFEFDTNFLLDVSYYRSETDNTILFFELLDKYEFVQKRISIGYAFDITQKFRVIPKLGYGQWSLSGKEGLFSFSTVQSTKVDGNKLMPQIDFEIPIREWFSINSSYSNTSFDFGNVQSFTAGVKFKFK